MKPKSYLIHYSYMFIYRQFCWNECFDMRQELHVDEHIPEWWISGYSSVVESDRLQSVQDLQHIDHSVAHFLKTILHHNKKKLSCMPANMAHGTRHWQTITSKMSWQPKTGNAEYGFCLNIVDSILDIHWRIPWNLVNNNCTHIFVSTTAIQRDLKDCQVCHHPLRGAGAVAGCDQEGGWKGWFCKRCRDGEDEMSIGCAFCQREVKTKINER